MIADDTEKRSPLGAYSPAAMSPVLRDRLLAAMKEAAQEPREASSLAAQYQPAPLQQTQRQRLLSAMLAARTRPVHRYRAWWVGSSAAVAAVVVGLFMWWPQQALTPSVAAKPAAPRVTMTRQVFGADANTHCDTFLMEEEGETRLVIRVSENKPVLLPDDVI